METRKIGGKRGRPDPCRVSFQPVLWAFLVLSTQVVAAWSPGPADPTAIGDSGTPLVVDTSDRNDVLSFYHCIYQASEGYAAKINWTGSVTGCDPGTTASGLKDDVRRRINFFRAMAGVPADIEFDAARNADAQAAALIMAEHGGLSHDPSSTWGTGGCWTAAGQNGAQKGNLALGSFGAESIDGYMEDSGGNNLAVGHRRWLINPPQTMMGTGDVPPGDHRATNCVFVIGSSTYRGVNPVEGSYYSWPPAGYVPSSTVWPRWSLHFNSSAFGSPTFSSATVSMKRVRDNAAIPVTVIYRYTGGGLAADPTIAWEPDWSGIGGTAPLEDELEVTVAGVTPGASGASTSYTYHVTVINEEAVTDPYDPTGPATPYTGGANYQITPLSGVGADQYEVEVSSLSSEAWVEGAENSPAPRVIDETGAYDLRASVTPAFGSPGARSGSKAFHLAFPEFADQWFEIDRDIIPTASSDLKFYTNFRFTVPDENRLGAEISTDGGGSWTEVWGRQAGGLSTTLWDTSWKPATVSLNAYQGQVVRVRFIFRYGSSAVTDTGLNAGCFIDDIAVSNSTFLTPGTVTDLGADTTFPLNATTAGGALVDGQTYNLRVRPTLGCRTFAWSSPLEVTATDTAGGYASWEHTPTVGGAHLDYDLDGLGNGIEYAFGLDPTDPTDADQMPGAMVSAPGELTLTMTEPAGVSDVLIGAQWSADLEIWHGLSDSGVGTTHTFTTPVGGERLFIRWTVVVN